MAIVWIVTTGNSDVKLDCDYGWGDLRTKKNNQLKPCHKNGFSSLTKGDDNLFFLPARAMGILYGDTWETHEKYFTFPLLEKLIQKIQDEGQIPDRIIILLTNQEKIFLDDSDDSQWNSQYDRSEDSPYWRDTCILEPIFKNYFDREFGNGKVSLLFPVLEPETREKGLDNWDSTLELVQKEFEKWNVSKGDSVIVSHQASTPAISSAVQFVSLAKFGHKVDFLIANERDPNLTRFLEGSKYLKEIRKSEAVTLLGRPDYPGVQILLKSYLKDDDTKRLLNAAIQWNFAEFSSFADRLEELSEQRFQNLVQEVKKRRQQWWWTAYEAAYLAVIRHKQENILEALFHSFRSVEGLICEWAIDKYKNYIFYDKKKSPQISAAIQEVRPNYWKKVEGKNQAWLNNLKECNQKREAKGKNSEPIGVGLFSQNLYWLLEDAKPDSKKDPFLKKGLYSAKDTRNQQFHRLLGLEEEDLKAAWDVNSISEWKETVIGCLNAIVKDDLPQDVEFRFPKDASLMVEVHQELEKAIADL